jgi:SAM-dependent methyltransferase
MTVAIGHRGYTVVRGFARALGISSARFPVVGAFADWARDPLESAQVFEGTFAAGTDPWNYLTSASEHERHCLALQLLDEARGGRRFEQALEIGSAEGIFTELLAARCESLLAFDYSNLALERARKRLAGQQQVTFQRWDLRCEPIVGKFDLIVAMDVLTCIRRPGRLRIAYDKLVSGMLPGGLLLAGDFRFDRDFENSWWRKRFLHGGKWVIEALAAHPALTTMKKAATDTHVFALLRKK